MKKHIKILKKKLKNFDPKLKEECGVFGVSNAKDASALTALGLHALQCVDPPEHRCPSGFRERGRMSGASHGWRVERRPVHCRTALPPRQYS